MSKETKETKICRGCKLRRPLKDFQLPRHKICTRCAALRIRNTLAYISPAQLIGVPTIDKSSREYASWARRMRYRANKMKPVAPPLLPPEHKLCRQCSQLKPVSEFASYRLRVCRACDGIITTGVKFTSDPSDNEERT